MLVAEYAPADVLSTDEVTILVVDDHRSFAELLAAAMNLIPGLRCVGTASTATEGIARAAELQPNIVVMDIQMPQQDGLQAARLIREVAPNTVIAVVTAHCSAEWVSKAARAGASAFIPKGGPLVEMIDILKRVRPGQMIVAPSTFSEKSADTRIPLNAPAPVLTARELQVLTFLGNGVALSAIAKTLGISLHTARGYVKSLHTKLAVSSQLEAVIKGQTLGLIGNN